MMSLLSVHDRDELTELLGGDPALHAYQLGDLDDFFWPYTCWYRYGDAVALVYHGVATPTVLAFDQRPGSSHALLAALAPLLPRRFHANLSPGAEQVLADRFDAVPGGPHVKMALTDPAALAEPLGTVLTPADLPELLALYEVAYPGNWFEARMLETGQYVGVRRDGELLAVAGVHVWSPRYGVAALGNVTTHPRARGEGLARGAVSALCRRLRDTVEHVTLNVRADNAAALALYGRLGFTPVAEYSEFTFTAR